MKFINILTQQIIDISEDNSQAAIYAGLYGADQSLWAPYPVYQNEEKMETAAYQASISTIPVEDVSLSAEVVSKISSVEDTITAVSAAEDTIVSDTVYDTGYEVSVASNTTTDDSDNSLKIIIILIILFLLFKHYFRKG